MSLPLVFKYSIPEKDRDNIYNTCTILNQLPKYRKVSVTSVIAVKDMTIVIAT